MVLTKLAICLASALVAAPAAQAGTLFLQGNGNAETAFGGGNFNSSVGNPATDYQAGDVLTDAQTAPAVPLSGLVNASNSYSGLAQFGHLGLQFQTSALGYWQGSTDYTSTASGTAEAYSTDALSAAGVQNGYLQLNLLFDGTFGGTHTIGSLFGLALDLQLNSANGAIVDLATGEGIYGPVDTPYAQTTYPSAATGPPLAVTLVADRLVPGQWDYTASGTIWLPIVAGSTSLSEALLASWNCTGSYYENGACTAGADFINSAMVGGAVVLDSNGNVVPGATVTSESGFNYNDPIPSGAATPEPASLALFGSGLAGLFAIRLLRRSAK
jgi:hypothetical protein